MDNKYIYDEISIKINEVSKLHAEILALNKILLTNIANRFNDKYHMQFTHLKCTHISSYEGKCGKIRNQIDIVDIDNIIVAQYIYCHVHFEMIEEETKFISGIKDDSIIEELFDELTGNVWWEYCTK